MRSRHWAGLAWRSGFAHAAEFLLYHAGQDMFQIRVAKTLDDVETEAESEQLAGVRLADAAAAQVINLLTIEGGAGRPMGAFDLIGVDFEAGQGIGFGFLTEEEVAARLVSIRVVGAFLD